MKRQYVSKQNIRDKSGVYTFRDYNKRPIYIGRATSLRNRIKSYFSSDLIETRGPRIVDMVTKAESLTWQETDNVLEAIILESTLIKRYQPRYNVDERDDKSSQYVVITDELWPRVFLARVRDFDQGIKEKNLSYKVLKYFGPYTESNLIKEALKILRKMFPFRDKKANDSRHEDFYKAIERSPNQSDDEVARLKYLQTIKYLILFFEGKKKSLRNKIKKEMDLAAKEMRFEDAMQSKKLLFAIDHINDIALFRGEASRRGLEASPRIEAYDIAHLSGTNVVGAMTVTINGVLQSSEYRRFKLSKEVNNDVAGLVEILFRRLNHSEWAYPDIIVVDGNQIQVKAAENVLKARRINIPVVGVTKDDKHKATEIIGNPELIKKYRKEIIAVNSEAHR
ncbi:MAG: GIY-YIG nuclease family protein, partial [Candidatus Paceibacterota bacterium]